MLPDSSTGRPISGRHFRRPVCAVHRSQPRLHDV
ncbi:TPA: hypothetical protein N0F65_012713 [Lagenidium giganteum]|uniref:Uncharacterized protein n=1 Tax=Lagenidium giganteum TaxID=4803 RepID=A0AAV2YGG6_9STRA|nr:TPA: hypothetical protein N0F65_012713 [Lagenidium giganteum]